MSDQTDDSQKTEEPTQKKLDDARTRGNIARSMEVNTWLMLFAGTLIVAFIAPGLMKEVTSVALVFVERPHEFSLEFGNLKGLLWRATIAIGTALILPAILLVITAVATGLVQNGIVFSPKALEPKLEKFSPIAGAKRLFSVRQFVEFVKGLIKISLVGLVALLLLVRQFRSIDVTPTIDLSDLMSVVHELVIELLVYVLAVLAVIAAIDFVFQRAQHRRRLRMTRQEVKDEIKQSEGDPHVKGRLRQIRMDRARQRMMQAVPDADVVVTNPTHFAVALRYREGETEAPVVVAKGQDFIAQKIREVAEEHDVPVVENRPLAQALFHTVEIDQEIPTEHYKAVAEVISYVWRLRGRVAGSRASRSASAA